MIDVYAVTVKLVIEYGYMYVYSFIFRLCEVATNRNGSTLIDYMCLLLPMLKSSPPCPLSLSSLADAEAEKPKANKLDKKEISINQ